MRKQLADAIRSLRPNAEFAVVGDTYSGVTWHDLKGDPIPTEVEVQTELNRLNTEAVRQAIRAHANERIARVYPDPRPVLMALRAIQLFNVIGQANWTAAQQNQAIKIRDAAEWMYQIDQKSTELEQSMPSDYTADYHWPLAPA